MKNEKREAVTDAPVFNTTLGREASAEFEEKKSVFIGHAKPVSTEEEALAFIKAKKAEFSDARHNVWAYRLRGDVVMRCSDDGEPQGSAGVPVLDTLKKSGVSDAVIVVTRYFGGILLGAGGLVRAYSHTAKLKRLERKNCMQSQSSVGLIVRSIEASENILASKQMKALVILGKH